MGTDSCSRKVLDGLLRLSNNSLEAMGLGAGRVLEWQMTRSLRIKADLPLC